MKRVGEKQAGNLPPSVDVTAAVPAGGVSQRFESLLPVLPWDCSPCSSRKGFEKKKNKTPPTSSVNSGEGVVLVAFLRAVCGGMCQWEVG